MKKLDIRKRIEKINDEILRETSNIIRFDLKDPRIELITSIVKVDTKNDLSQSKIYISVMGDKEKKEEVMDVFKKASGYIRSKLALKINLRNTPELKFILDESLEYSIKIENILDRIKQPIRDDKNEYKK